MESGVVGSALVIVLGVGRLLGVRRLGVGRRTVGVRRREHEAVEQDGHDGGGIDLLDLAEGEAAHADDVQHEKSGGVARADAEAVGIRLEHASHCVLDPQVVFLHLGAEVAGRTQIDDEFPRDHVQPAEAARGPRA